MKSVHVTLNKSVLMCDSVQQQQDSTKLYNSDPLIGAKLNK